MKKVLLCVLMLMTFGMSGFAQSSVTIGVGDFTDWTSPIGGHYGYHYTAMLYTTEELNSMAPGSTISGMAFHLFTCNSGSVPVWIWLYETSSSSIDDSQSWNALTGNATLVYDGDMANHTVDPTTDSWLEFDFDTPNPYQGGNLVLLVYSTGCTTSGGCAKWGYFTNGFTGTGQAYICPKDGSPNNVTSPLSSYSRRNNGQYKSDVRFDYTEGAVSCHSVSGLNVSNILSTSADASWSAPADAGTYYLEYKQANQSWESSDVVSQSLYDTTYQLTNLLANTTYNLRVRNVCSASDSSFWQSRSFTTPCGEITTLPVMDGFDTYGTGDNSYPTCWTKINTYSSNRPYVSTTNYEGSGSLYFYAGSSGTYNIAIMPGIDPSIPINTLQARFMYRASYNSDRLIVGVMEDINSAASFVPVDTIYPNSSPSTWEEQTVVFSNYYGTGINIAFKNEYTTTSAYGYMDNLVVDVIPACGKPTGVTLSNYTTDGCDVDWNVNGDETAWEVVAVQAGMDVNTGTPEYTSSHPFTITNLSDNTQYDVYVRSDCGGGEYSGWSFKKTFTTNPLCTAPVNVGSSQVTGTSALISWEPAEFGATGYTVGYSEAGLENWTTQLVTGTSYMISGLTPNTTYDVYVDSECDQGDATSVHTTVITPCMAGGDPFTDGTLTSYLLPLNNYYNYSFTQQIYLASELNGATTLDSIAFHYNYSTPPTAKTNVTIYMGHTSQSSFSSSSNYVPATDLQQVYTGSMNCHQGWNTFVFSTPFQYNGSDNLVIVVDDNSGDYDGTSYVYSSHNAGANRSLYFYSDSYNPDVSNPTAAGASSSTTSTRSDVKFFIPCDNTVTCVAPNAYVSEFTSTTVTVAWVPGYTENAWEVEYRAQSDADWTPEGTVSASPYTISNLNPNTLYSIRLRSVCGGGEYSAWFSMQIRTACSELTALPFTDNFNDYGTGESAYPSCWSKINTYSSERPYVNTTSFEGAGALYFYAGSTGTYNIAILPPFDTQIPLNTLQATFMYRGYYSSDELVVGVMTNPTNAATFVPVATIHPASTASEWVERTVSFANYTGDGQYIAFKNAYTSTSAYAYIDLLEVDLIPSCPKPSQVTATSTPTDTVYLAWTDPTGTTWDIIYGPSGFDPENDMGTATIEQGVTENPYTITGLSGGMAYDFYVRSDCGGGLVSGWCSYPASAYPFSYPIGITGSDTLAGCGFTITDDGGPNGDYSNNCDYTLVVYPSSNDSLVSITGTFSGEGSLDYLKIYNGVGTAASDLIAHIYSGTSGTVINFGPFTSDAGPITLFFHTDGSVVYPGFVAEISCVEAPNCLRPMQFVTIGSSSSEVTLDWLDHGETSWNIEYGPTGFTQGNGTVEVATAHPHTVSNLTSGTTYDFYVQADCGGGDTSLWTGPVTVTPGSYNIPSSGNNTLTACDIVIYDDGGLSGDYSSNSDSYLTIYPETTSSLVAVSGTVSTESCCDYLRVYDGVGTAGTLLGEYKGENLTVPTLVSTSGPITLHFYSDGSVVKSGFALNVSCVSNTCPVPTNLSFSNVSNSSADIAWTPGGSESTWNLEYRESSASTWTPVVVTGSSSYQLTGLNSGTLYIIRVQADCSVDDQSMWVNGSFSTECDIFNTLPYTMDFEGYAGTTYTDNNGIAPNCWTTYSTNTTYGAPHIIGSGTYHYSQSGNSLIFTCGSAGSDAYAALPTFNDALNTLSLSFWRGMESTSSGTLTVGYVTDLNDLAGTFVQVASIPSVSSSGDTANVDITGAGIPAAAST